ncbi:hypothetical protein [Microbispora sp. ATCC PTA-5024]|uniref:hypothetical protein n=1 Tax=Microbispora sp. ATCC PTA-5024 TaxID=316330 RepID=UPI0003DB6AC2|nr:hypothetical protein [Microbispora sp. ATCC PTA-5024]ETK37461.1 hypothetical protein MPTA5024_03690 [Microbispora sp. ATCC PTA-5024]
MTVTEATRTGQSTRTSRGRTTTATPATTAQKPVPTPPVSAEKTDQGFNLSLPFLRIQVRPPDMHLPHVGLPKMNRRDMGHAVDIARTFLPPPERIVYYGGLGALAAIGLLDWPVAAAIGAGTMIAQRTRAKDQRWSPLRGQQEQPGRQDTGATGTTGTTRAGGRTTGGRTAAQTGAGTTTGRAAGQRAEARTTARGTTARSRAGTK